MTALILPRRFQSQPNDLVEIDRSNPLTNGLLLAYIPGARNDATGRTRLPATTMSGGGSWMRGGDLLSPGTHRNDGLLLGNGGLLGPETNSTVVVLGSTLAGTLGGAGSENDGLLGSTGAALYCERNASPGTNIYKLEWVFSGGILYVQFTYRNDSSSLIQPRAAIWSPVAHNNGLPYLSWARRTGTSAEVGVGRGIKSTSASPPTATFTNSGIERRLGSDANDTLASWNGTISLVAGWSRALSDNEIASLDANPWQIFKPRRQVLYFDVGGAGPQTVSVTHASESDAAQSVTVVPGARTIAVTHAAETNAAQAITARGSYTLALSPVLETDASQAITVRSSRTLAVSHSTETDAAQAVTARGSYTLALNPALETNAAQAITARSAHTLAVSAAAETDAAQAITAIVSGATLVGHASETDTARTITPVPGAVTVAVSAATESDAAQAITALNGLTIPLGAATEVGTVGAITPVPGGVIVTINAASETGTAQDITVFAPGNVTLTQADLDAIAAAVWADPAAVAAHAKLDAILARITC